MGFSGEVFVHSLRRPTVIEKIWDGVRHGQRVSCFQGDER